jgi:hypothetical protein
MLTALAIVAVAGVCTVLVSIYMWWATRSGLAAMIAGLILTVVVLIGAVVIGWLLTRSFMSGLP